MKKIIQKFPCVILLLFTSCASLNTANFSSETPKLDPVEFFGGSTTSKGVVENYKGKPIARITTTTEVK